MPSKRTRDVDYHFAIWKRTSRHKTLCASAEWWDGPFTTLKHAQATLRERYATSDEVFFIVRTDYKRMRRASEAARAQK